MKKFLKNPWTIAIGAAIFSFMLTVLRDIISGEQILSTVSSIFSVVGNGIVSFLNFNLKVWWVLVGLAVIFVALWCISNFFSVKETLEFLSYTQDTIQGWKWEWTWKKDIYGKFDVSGLHPICSKCGTPLVRSQRYYGGLECLRCGKEYEKELPELDYVKMMIVDNVRRNLYSKAGNNQ